MKNNNIHKKLQEYAIKKAITSLIGNIGTCYIRNGTIIFRIEEEQTKVNDELIFNLPSHIDILKKAKRIYKNIDVLNIEKIIYNFWDVSNFKKIKIKATGADVELNYKNYDGLTIVDSNNVNIKGSPVNNGSVNIKANCINILEFYAFLDGNIYLESPIIKIKDAYNLTAKDIRLKADLIELTNANIYSNNLFLESDCILTEETKLSATEKIEIIDNNFDEIKSVESPVVIYNGIDISNSDSIQMSKLRKNLIDVLYNVRTMTKLDMEVEIKKETEKLRENLKNSPISKVLKKKKNNNRE